MINLPAHSIHRAAGRGIFPPEMAAHTEKEKEEQRIAGQKLNQGILASQCTADFLSAVLAACILWFGRMI